MLSNFIANGYTNLEEEIKELITKKYEPNLSNAGFFKKLKIKCCIKFEVIMKLLKMHKEISSETLFLKK